MAKLITIKVCKTCKHNPHCHEIREGKESCCICSGKTNKCPICVNEVAQMKTTETNVTPTISSSKACHTCGVVGCERQNNNMYYCCHCMPETVVPAADRCDFCKELDGIRAMADAEEVGPCSKCNQGFACECIDEKNTKCCVCAQGIDNAHLWCPGCLGEAYEKADEDAGTFADALGQIKTVLDDVKIYPGQYRPLIEKIIKEARDDAHFRYELLEHPQKATESSNGNIPFFVLTKDNFNKWEEIHGTAKAGSVAESTPPIIVGGGEYDNSCCD